MGGSVRGGQRPVIWVEGAQGAGKTTFSWRLSRARDLPLHSIDLWSYDHQRRLPASDSLDDQLARGAEAAADAFESISRLRLACCRTSRLVIWALCRSSWRVRS